MYKKVLIDSQYYEKNSLELFSQWFSLNSNMELTLYPGCLLNLIQKIAKIDINFLHYIIYTTFIYMEYPQQILLIGELNTFVKCWRLDIQY